MQCKQTVRECDIQLAENMLNEFCDLFEKYYGLDSITMNIHLLRHLGDVVRNCGPLWCHSLFGFETNMGVLKKYYAGGRFLLEQITNKYILSKSIRENRMTVSDSCKVGVPVSNMEQFNDILIENGLKNIEKFAQVSNRKGIYKSLASKHTESIDHFFQMKDGQIGAAVLYAEKNEDIYVLIQKYTEINSSYHLTEVFPTENYSVYKFSFIQEKLLYLKFSTREIVTKEPNMYEHC